MIMIMIMIITIIITVIIIIIINYLVAGPREAPAPERRADHHTVNCRYSGYPWDHDLESVIARVRNSGMRENFYF